MARRKEAGTLKLSILGAALIGGLALPAQAAELELGGTATLTTDYVFRGITQTDDHAAVQASLDATYGIFYLGAWGSNVDWGGTAPPAASQDLVNIEIDYYAGITPEWRGISFDIGGIYYTYPDAYDPGAEFDYFELKTGASYTFFEALTVGVTNYYSPEFSGETGTGNATELAAEYAFTNKWWMFTPSVSGLVGWQYIEDGDSYTYWNAGLTLGFMDNWSADIRYWDTDSYAIQSGPLNGDSRVVGTLSASF